MPDTVRHAAVLAAINDLIFETKIRSTAEQLAVPCTITRDSAEVAALVESHAPGLLIVDLNTLNAGAIDAVRAGCSHPAKPFVLAFAAHVDERLAKEAADAGAHQVIPRSKFSADLPAMITKHCRKPE